MSSRRKSGGVSVLLMLSAIDMLTASLVCAIILFVVLVGSDAATQRVVPSSASAIAPSLVEAISPAGSQGISVAGMQGGDKPLQVDQFDDFVRLLIAGPKWGLQRFRLPPGQHQLQVERAAENVVLIIHSVQGARKIVALRCTKLNKPILIDFEPKLAFQNSCEPSLDAHAFNVSTGMQFLAVISGLVSRAGDWKTSNVRRVGGGADELNLTTTKDGLFGDKVPLIGMIR